jgi:hypothetical protein
LNARDCSPRLQAAQIAGKGNGYIRQLFVEAGAEFPQFLDGVARWRRTHLVVGETGLDRTEVPRTGATQMHVQ